MEKPICKSESDQICITWGIYQFIDAMNFFPSGSLSSLTDDLAGRTKKDLIGHPELFHIHNEAFKQLYPDYNPYVSTKILGMYYTWIIPERMEEKQLPDKRFGRNDLHNIDMTDEEDKNNHEVWKEYQCETIYDFRELYEWNDIFLLADIWEHFSESARKVHHLISVLIFQCPVLIGTQ